MPSTDSPTSTANTCTLWVHNPAFSADDILFNASSLSSSSLSVGSLLKVIPSEPDGDTTSSKYTRPSPVVGRGNARRTDHEDDAVRYRAQPLVFIARDLAAEQRTRHPNLQISVSESIAAVHGLYSRMVVEVAVADERKHAASHVELTFKDPLNRADLWKLTVAEMRSKRCLYQGQSLLYLGIVEVFVRKIYINGQKVPSALFSVHSKPIFRSAASRFILGIQISSEMSGLDHDASGDISWGKVLAFLKELFDRWRVISATHMVSIVLYTRLEYSTDRSPPTKEPQNIHPDDYYRVVSSEMPSSDCRDILPRMTSEYKSFLRDIMIRSSNVSSIPEVRGRPSAAIAGNFLEAVNVAVSACLYNDTDLDFIRTGASILMITAGPAMFHANEQLLRVTTDRLLARSIGVELVSLSQKPTHTAPLLKLREDSSSNVNRGKEKESYVVPSWLEISFYEGPKAMSNSSPDVLAYDTEPPNGFRASRTIPVEFSAVPLADQQGREEQIINHPNSTLEQSSEARKGGLPALDVSFESQQDDRNGRLRSQLDEYDDYVHIPRNSMQRRPTAKSPAEDPLHPPAMQMLNSSPKPRPPIRGTTADPFVFDQKMPTTASTSFREAPTAMVNQANTRSETTSSEAEPTEKKQSKKHSATYSLANLLGGRITSKSIATTSSSMASAKSPSSHFQRQPSSEPSNDPKSVSKQVRVSLSRTTSAATSPNGSKRMTRPIPLIPNSSTSMASRADRTASSSMSGSMDNESSFLDMFRPGSYSRRKKPGTLPCSLEQNDSMLLKSKTRQDVPWFVVQNPFDSQKGAKKMFGEWLHVSTHQNRSNALKFKPLCFPASLPLTTEDFPTAQRLRDDFSKYPYKLAVITPENDSSAMSGLRAHLVREMIQSRIADGFQIAVGPESYKITGSRDVDLYADDFMTGEGAALLVIKRDNVQLICASMSEISVTRFQRKARPAISLSYQAMIRTALDREYTLCRIPFTESNDRNWNAIDHQIANQDQNGIDMAEVAPFPTVETQKARFVLLPVQPSGTARHGAAPQWGDTDEEVRIEGIRTLTILWQRNRWTPPAEKRHRASWTGHKDPNPLSIEYQTRDPSAVVATGFENSPILIEGQATVASTQLFNESEAYRTSHVDMHKLATDIQGDNGIVVRSRRWHFKVFEASFVGTDFTSYLLASFQDLQTREDAVEFGNVLMSKGLFFHVRDKHAFRDGNYFYSINEEYRIHRPDAKTSTWFGSRRHGGQLSIPSTPLSEHATRDSPDVNKRSHSFFPSSLNRPKVSLSASMQYNVDPKGTSSRSEVITVHYDRLHNPANSFHFQLEWSNATARLIEESLVSWAIVVAKYGLRLIQVPLAEVSSIRQINPLRSPYEVEVDFKQSLAPDRPITDSPLLNPQQMSGPVLYQKAILRKLDYVLDLESGPSFPSDIDVTYSWGTPNYRYSQYIHKSGLLLVQILGDWKFSLLANRLYINRTSMFRGVDRTPEKRISDRRSASDLKARPTSAIFNTASTVSSPLVHPSKQSRPSPGSSTTKRLPLTAELLKDEFEAFCQNTEALRALYDEVLRPTWSRSGKPTPAMTATGSSSATPSMIASIPSLELNEQPVEEDLELSPIHDA